MPLANLKPIPYTRRMRKKASEDLPAIPGLMTIEQVSVAKGVTTAAVYNAIRDGKLHPQRIGKIQVLLQWEVDRWKPQRRPQRAPEAE